MHIDRGALVLGKLGGVPIGLHWTLPIGFAVLTNFHFEVWTWLALGLLIFIHEGGHALVAKWAGGRPTRIVVSGFGGFCEWSGFVSPVGRAAIAFGGVWAQAVVLIIALIIKATHEAPVFYGPTASVMHIAIDQNAWLMLLNLVPIAPLDGSEAWQLPILLGRRARAALSKRWRRRHLSVVATDEAEEPEVSDEAKRIAKQLLDDAKRGGDA